MILNDDIRDTRWIRALVKYCNARYFFALGLIP